MAVPIPTKIGESVTYWRGLLSADCEKKNRNGSYTHPDARAARRAFWNAYELGIVSLTQKRHGDCDYSYIATVVK